MTRKLIISLFLLCLVTAPVLAENAAITQIRKIYQTIQTNLAQFKTETVDLENNYSTEGGTAKAFRDNDGKVRLIKVELYFETGKVFKEFYYDNDKLVFAFYQNHQYNAPILTDQPSGGQTFDEKKTIITEDRYYFDEAGHLIQWLKKGKRTDDKKMTFKEAEMDITYTTQEMRAKFK